MRRRSRNRSSCASGSGKVPLSSTGFWVASTRKGRGSGCVAPSTVTWRSSMASRKLDWVRGVARLISSASTRLAKIGPGLKSKSLGALVEDLAAGDVAGQQVGRALHAHEAQAERGGQGAHQQRLGDAGHVVEQHVAFGEQRDEQQTHLLVLADDDLLDRSGSHRARAARPGRCRPVRRSWVSGWSFMGAFPFRRAGLG